MDSLTQIALGATVAAVCVEPKHRRKAIMVGAVLGTLPDLDVLIDYGDAVSNFTYHRGFSHSLFVLTPLAVGLWWLLKQFYEPVMASPKRWFYAVLLTLITHPLLDAHTVYGTQLLWPIPTPPVMWSTLFIIDPLYTLPLLVGMIAILIRPRGLLPKRLLASGLVLSTLYLGWSWVSKNIAESAATQALAQLGSSGRILTTPTPFNTLVWRVLAVEGDQYLEGYYSALAPNKPIAFTRYDKNEALLRATSHLESVGRLEWFSHGFIKGSIEEDYLVVTDLRMGVEGNYVFSHAVASSKDEAFLPISSYQVPQSFSSAEIAELWDKIKALH